MSTAIQTQPQDEFHAPAVVTPMAMLDRALASGASIETLERLMALQERWQASQARQAFDEALAKAKGEIGPINKNRRVHFKAKSAGASDTDYRHEDLAEIANAVGPALAKNGLSYTYSTQQDLTNGGRVTVTCKLRHSGGHWEETVLSASPDNSGNKNNLQMIASAVTYLQRYTLKAALGLAVSNVDDDGRAGGGGGVETVSEDQIGQLLEMMDSVGADKPRFLTHFKIERVSDLAASDFDRAVALLQQKARRQ